MTHDTHVLDGVNKDFDLDWTRTKYLQLAKGWEDPYGPLAIEPFELTDEHGHTKECFVVRDDLLDVGSKCRFGDLLVSQIKSDTITYVAPRVGFAGISLAHLAAKYKKRLVLFCPAAAEPSLHQLKALELGAELRFIKIAAMPVLNKYAKEWAVNYKAAFIPLGLKDRMVTAAIVKVCQLNLNRLGARITEVWCAVSTGVLSRGLQIGLPRHRHFGVAVARNLKEGEAGQAKIYSHNRAFHQDAYSEPPFPSVLTYDAKVLDMMKLYAKPRALMWNVACEPVLKGSIINKPKSQREWGDLSDLEKP